jgi:LemA protein
LEPFLICLTLLIILVWLIISYNNLVKDRNQVAAGWSDIDVQLTRRHELIPNLVKATKAYADHEQSLLNSVTQLRSQSAKLDQLQPKAISQKSQLEDKLTSSLGQIMALVENYPDLKADTSFIKLQTELVEIENHLQYARRFYNGAVRNFNTRIESFPDLLVAKLFNFMPAEFFQLQTDQAATSVNVDF